MVELYKQKITAFLSCLSTFFLVLFYNIFIVTKQKIKVTCKMVNSKVMADVIVIRLTDQWFQVRLH